MKKNFLIIASIFALLSLTGCAHHITITPNQKNLELVNSDLKLANKIDANVAYHISPELNKLIVKSPGGGGDKVSYKPYKDLSSTIYMALSTRFENVSLLKSLDKEAIQKKNITYIFTPLITTTSNSDSAFTWPPTEFSITLTCEAVDTKGSVLWTKTVTGEGKASYSEFKSDFALSAELASEDLYQKLVIELQKFPITNNK